MTRIEIMHTFLAKHLTEKNSLSIIQFLIKKKNHHNFKKKEHRCIFVRIAQLFCYFKMVSLDSELKLFPFLSFVNLLLSLRWYITATAGSSLRSAFSKFNSCFVVNFAQHRPNNVSLKSFILNYFAKCLTISNRPSVIYFNLAKRYSNCWLHSLYSPTALSFRLFSANLFIIIFLFYSKNSLVAHVNRDVSGGGGEKKPQQQIQMGFCPVVFRKIKTIQKSSTPILWQILCY